MTNAIDLHSCPPDELAEWLLINRFENNAVDTASFLLQCTSTLPNAAEISAQLMGGENEEDEIEEEAPAVNPVLQSSPLPPFVTKEQASIGVEVSCTNPRGRFLMKLHKTGIILNNPKKEDEMLTIPSSSVENVIWFRKGEEYKKLKSSSGKGKPLPGHMVLICFKQDSNVMFRGKGVTQVCLQLPSYSDDGETEGQFTEKQWWDGLRTALCSEGNSNMIRVHSKMDDFTTIEKTECFTFQSEGAPGSSTTTEGMPYVGCYHGLNDGVLYPLREGLLFFKPPLFVPRSKLSSISCGRGSGSASRYVDMVIQLETEESIEFTNISREQLGVLNDYIHKTLIPAMQTDVDGNCSDSDGAVAVEVVGSDDCEEDSETESTGVKRDRPLRAASRTAREATRAHFDQGPDDNESSDEEDFQSDDSNSASDSDDTERNTDEEAVVSSDEEEEMVTDGEDENNVRHTKKPRVSNDSEMMEQ